MCKNDLQFFPYPWPLPHSWPSLGVGVPEAQTWGEPQRMNALSWDPQKQILRQQILCKNRIKEVLPEKKPTMWF